MSLYIKRALVLIGCVAALAPATALAAGGADDHHGFPWSAFIAAWVNFAIFAAILYKFAVPQMRSFFAARRELLSANLNEAKRLREEAESRLAQYQGRLDALDTEREALLEEYNRQGEREKERIVREATEHAAKLRADAELMVEQEIKKAKAELERVTVDEAVRRAMERAESELARPGAQERLVDRYASELESMAQQGA